MVVVENVKAHGEPLAHPVAVESQAAMALICLVFVGLCVRSFIAARKALESSRRKHSATANRLHPTHRIWRVCDWMGHPSRN